MTADTAVAPIVRWDPLRMQLVTPEGFEVTRKQDFKVRQYIERDCIRCLSETSGVVCWGRPWKRVETYEIKPIPGCRQTRTVKVTVWHDAVGGISAVDYACDCQKSCGTVSVRPGLCSHTLAVHRYRRETTKIADKEAT